MIITKADTESVNIASEYIKSNKLIILPTDTIYGFSAAVPDGARLITEAKGRDEGKPFIELLAKPEELFLYCKDTINPGLLSLWPGAVTFIVRTVNGSTTAFRCPGDPWLRNVISRSGNRIYSTSANRAGEPSLGRISDIIRVFGKIADLIIDDGDHVSGLASTLIDVTANEYRIIRQGSVEIPVDYLHSINHGSR